MARTILIATLFVVMSCTTWRPATVQPKEIPHRHSQATVRVYRSGGTSFVITNPYVQGDSLYGLGRCQFGVCGVALRDVASVSVQQVDGARTTALIAGLGITALVAVAAANAAAEPPPPRQPVSFTSCPLVYSWDGHRWRLDSGTFGGAILRALKRTDVDNLNFVQADGGVVRLRLADELPETEYVDAVSLYAVDHEPGVAVAPDGTGRLHALRALHGATSARDFSGRDILTQVGTMDGWSWESPLRHRDTSRASDIRDGVILSFPRPRTATRAHLVVDGNVTPWGGFLMGEFIAAHGTATDAWYAAMDSAPERARRIGAALGRDAFLAVAVRAGDQWSTRGLFWEAPPELVKRQVMELDLIGVQGDSLVLRLESAPSFWMIDQVRVSYEDDRPFEMYEAHAARGRAVGDRPVLELVAREDSAEFVMETGDWAELEFDVPPVPEGRARSFLLRTTGWYRIHAPGTGEPQRALLDRIETEPLAVSRVATAKLNAAFAVLSERR